MLIELEATRRRTLRVPTGGLARWRRGVPLVLAIGVAAWLVAPQVGDLPAGFAAVVDARPGWLLLAVIAAVLPHVASAIALQGAVPARLCYLRTTQVQVAAASATAVTPAGIAGMAINARYLERTGVARDQALAAVAVARASAFVVHLLTLAALSPWLIDRLGVTVPTVGRLVATAAGIAVLVATVAVACRAARIRAAQLLRRAERTVGQVAPDRGRLGLLLAGSFAISATRALTLYACMRALEGRAPLLAVAALFLAAEAAGAVATTPAGLGVLDAVTLTGLGAFGVVPASAIGAVVLFRLLTVWGPVVPGLLALRRLRRVRLL